MRFSRPVRGEKGSIAAGGSIKRHTVPLKNKAAGPLPDLQTRIRVSQPTRRGEETRTNGDAEREQGQEGGTAREAEREILFSGE